MNECYVMFVSFLVLLSKIKSLILDKVSFLDMRTDIALTAAIARPVVSFASTELLDHLGVEFLHTPVQPVATALAEYGSEFRAAWAASFGQDALSNNARVLARDLEVIVHSTQLFHERVIHIIEELQ